MRNKTQSGGNLKRGNRVTGAAEYWAKERAKLYRPRQIWVAIGDHFEPLHIASALRDDEIKFLRFAKGMRAPGSAVTKRKNELGYGR